MFTAHRFAIQESSQVGEARRIATAFAQKAGLSEENQNKVALIVTELGTNLVKHTDGKGGEILVQSAQKEDASGIEILCLDRAQGIDNISQAMRDGYSSEGTSGAGLGGIQRLSSHFELYSRPNQGTVILSQIFEPQEKPSSASGMRSHLEFGAVCVPIAGEEIPGDLWTHFRRGNQHQFILSDGLGHGLLAHEASQEALTVFSSSERRELTHLFESMQSSLHSTRGAAVSVLSFSAGTRSMQYMGIGNICASVVGPSKTSHMVSLNGIVGHEIRKLQQFDYSFPDNSLLVMHSDGMSTKWSLDQYPGLSKRHPSLISAVLYRDFSRGRDDVTVLVARERPGRA